METSQLLAAFKIPGAVWASMRKLWEFKPHLVVGVGEGAGVGLSVGASLGDALGWSLG